MATWHYAEVTGDGGVALSFGDFEDAMLDEEDLSQLYEAMGNVEAEDAGAEEVQVGGTRARFRHR